MWRFVLPVILLMHFMPLRADSVRFESGTQQVALLELFTSQGCSSCPIAEEYLADLGTKEDALWKKVVPVAWHVDYWDKLGWKDPLAKQNFTHRQYNYVIEDRIKNPYTPNFMLNGKESRGLVYGLPLRYKIEEAPELKVRLSDGILTASMDSGGKKKLILNVAVLGNGISTIVTRGENYGKTLEQDFIVLEHFTAESEIGEWKLNLRVPAQEAMSYGLAVWVTEMDSVDPIQATGGWITLDCLTPTS